jgi:hypothetical protein
MSGKLLRVFIFLLAIATARAQTHGLLQMFDGSALHGYLAEISPGRGIAWAIPASKEPIVLRPDNISGIRFEDIAPPASTNRPTCRFRFQNGDEILGDLISIDGEHATIRSWVGGELTAPTYVFAAMQFSARGFKVLYEGPNGEDGWKTGRGAKPSWTYRDGAFMANGADILGRDFGLTNSSSLEFDLAWSGNFSLTITLYAQTIDRFDYSTSAYVLYLSPGGVSVQRIQAGAGAMMLGRADLPMLAEKNRARLEIRSNKEEGTLSLSVDGQLISRWRDPKGFVSSGSGIVFYSNLEAVQGPALKLSNIKVSEWDGRYEPDLSTNGPVKEDIVFLANKDRVAGKIEKFADGKIHIQSHATALKIPLSRVTELYFADTRTNVAALTPWSVRAAFPGGESVSFLLEKWTGSEVAGRSANFGPVAFNPKTIRSLRFNLQRGDMAAAAAPAEDEFIPELEEEQ